MGHEDQNDPHASGFPLWRRRLVGNRDILVCLHRGTGTSWFVYKRQGWILGVRIISPSVPALALLPLPSLHVCCRERRETS
jgi:hypothetical protein